MSPEQEETKEVTWNPEEDAPEKPAKPEIKKEEEAPKEPSYTLPKRPKLKY